MGLQICKYVLVDVFFVDDLYSTNGIPGWIYIVCSFDNIKCCVMFLYSAYRIMKRLHFMMCEYVIGSYCIIMILQSFHQLHLYPRSAVSYMSVLYIQVFLYDFQSPDVVVVDENSGDHDTWTNQVLISV